MLWCGKGLWSQATWAGWWLYQLTAVHLGRLMSAQVCLSFLTCQMRTLIRPSSLGDLEAVDYSQVPDA